jgi:hypothetical protein
MMRGTCRIRCRSLGLFALGLAGLALALATAMPARASSQESWAALFKAASAACATASGLAGATPVGDPVDFSDRVLVVVRGRWPQPHMTGEPPATFACLFPKLGGPAEAHEIRLP